MHPEAQRKAQAEIDKVVGNDRLPTLADQPNLPYTDALVKEVLRWNPVAPLGKSAVFRSRDLRSHLFQETNTGTYQESHTLPPQTMFTRGISFPRDLRYSRTSGE